MSATAETVDDRRVRRALAALAACNMNSTCQYSADTGKTWHELFSEAIRRTGSRGEFLMRCLQCGQQSVIGELTTYATDWKSVHGY